MCEYTEQRAAEVWSSVHLLRVHADPDADCDLEENKLLKAFHQDLFECQKKSFRRDSAGFSVPGTMVASVRPIGTLVGHAKNAITGTWNTFLYSYVFQDMATTLTSPDLSKNKKHSFAILPSKRISALFSDEKRNVFVCISLRIPGNKIRNP